MIVRHAMLLSCACLCIGSSDTRGLTVLAPGVISTNEYESHPAFDPSGKLLLFVRSDPDFSNWQIWQSARTRSGWGSPRLADFSREGLNADPFFAPDRQNLYFISTRLAPGKTKHDLDIWVVRRLKSGWGTPERLPSPINSPAQEWFPRLQRDGSLYFGSDRPGGLGATDIYRARRTATEWDVANLGSPVNSAGDEYEFELAPNGKFAVLMAADPNTSGDLYLVCRSGAAWSARRQLEPEINTPALEVGPLFTRDGRHLYFSSRRSDPRLGDIYRIAISRQDCRSERG